MAGTEVGKIFYSLDLDDSKFKQGLGDASQKTKGFGNEIDKTAGLSRGLLLGVGAAAAGAVAFGVSSVKAFQESQGALAQLNAVLQSTGGVAGVTAKDVTDLSTALEMTTGVSDEAMTSAQSMLLTFTNIGKSVFPTAAKAALDMATAMNGGAIPSAEQLRNESILLGKALQDPDAGLGALHRVGVNTDELAKKFTPLMSLEEKQKLILQELGTEFGKSSDAAGKTFAGQLNIAKERVNDLQEAIGQTIIKAIAPLVVGFNTWFDKAGGVDGAMKSLGKTVEKYMPIIGGLATFIGVVLVNAFLALTKAMVANAIAFAATPIGMFAIAIGVIAGLAILIIQNWGPISQFFTDLWTGITTAFNDGVNAVKTFFTDLGTAISTTWTNIQTAFNDGVNAVVAFFVALPMNIAYWLGWLVGRFIQFIIVDIPNFINGIINWFAQLPGNIALWLSNMWTAVMEWFGKTRDGAVRTTNDLFNAVINFFRALPGNIASFAGQMAGAARNLASSAYNGLMDTLRNLPGQVGGVFNSVWRTISGWAGQLYNQARNLAGNVWKGFKDGLGIHSPSYIEEAFMAIGEQGKETLSGMKTQINAMSKLSAGSMALGGINMAGGGGATQNQSVQTSIYGNIVIGSEVDGDNFLSRLSRNQELAQAGLTTK